MQKLLILDQKKEKLLIVFTYQAFDLVTEKSNSSSLLVKTEFSISHSSPGPCLIAMEYSAGCSVNVINIVFTGVLLFPISFIIR